MDNIKATDEKSPLRSSISVVFPAYNEELNIEATIKQALAVFPKYFETVEIIPVNDGSSDQTGNIIDRLEVEFPQVKSQQHEINLGYGAAVKTGLRAAKNDYIFFSDSDGQFDFAEIVRLVEHIDTHDLVVGYRENRADPWHRKLNAFCWGSLVRFLFGINIRDIDCAFKLFKKEVIDNITIEAEGAMISTEILAQAGLLQFKAKEVPVSHYPRVAGEQTGANIFVVIKAFIELFKLYGKLKPKQMALQSSK